MKIQKIEDNKDVLIEDVIYLKFSYFDDYGYATTCDVYMIINGECEHIGSTKLGCIGLASKVNNRRIMSDYSSHATAAINDVFTIKYYNK